MNKSAGLDAPNPGSPLAAMPWLNGLSGETMIRSLEAFSQACQDWQREVVRFAVARIQAESQHLQQLVASQNLADAEKLHQDWAVATAQEYAKEANHMAELASKLGSCLAGVAGKPPPSLAAD